MTSRHRQKEQNKRRVNPPLAGAILMRLAREVGVSFNSRTRRGCDAGRSRRSKSIQGFNSRTTANVVKSF